MASIRNLFIQNSEVPQGSFLVRLQLFQNLVCKKILTINKQRHFLRLQKQIKINVISYLSENKIRSSIPLDENIYDFVAQVIFVL